MTSLNEKIQNRWLMLHEYYALSNGRSNTHIISMWDVGRRLGWEREKTLAAYEYLEGEGLLVARTLGGGAAITHAGVKEVELTETEPHKPTLYFPPNIIYYADNRNLANIQDRSISVGGSVTGSALVTGDNNSTSVRYPYVGVNVDPVQAALSSVSEEVEKSGNAAAFSLLGDLKEEMRADQRNKTKLRQLWQGLTTILPSVNSLEGAVSILNKELQT